MSSRRVIWVALLVLSGALASCGRKPPAAEPPGNTAPAGQATTARGAAAASTVARGGPDDLLPEQAGGEKQAAPGGAEVVPTREIQLRRRDSSAAAQQPAGAASPLQQEEQSLLALPASSTLPEDFRIGELADLLRSDNPSQAAASVARGFLDSLVRGEIDLALIDAERREELNRSLGFHLSSGDRPEAYRLGRLEIAADDPNQAWSNLRLFGAAGRTEGELYLRRRSQRWYVLDVQADLAALRQPYDRAEERFYPSVYAWGLD